MSRQSDRVFKQLNDVPRAVREAVKPTLEKMADDLVRAQRSAAPKDTGELAQTIHKQPGAHETQVKVVADSDHARFVEFGTIHAAPEPYFFGPYRLLRKRFKKSIAVAVGKAIRAHMGTSK